MDNIIGKNILEYRDNLGMTQEELSGALGVYSMQIAKWENGEDIPSVEQLAQIATVLKTSPAVLNGTEKGTDTHVYSSKAKLSRVKLWLSLANGIIGLIAVVLFIILLFAVPGSRPIIPILFAFPMASLVSIVVLALIYKRLSQIQIISSTSSFVWLLAIAICFTIGFLSYGWIALVVAIPLQIALIAGMKLIK